MLKWYSQKNYTVTEGNPLSLDYAFDISLSYDPEAMELTEAVSCIENTIFTDSTNEGGEAYKSKRYQQG